MRGSKITVLMLATIHSGMAAGVAAKGALTVSGGRATRVTPDKPSCTYATKVQTPGASTTVPVERDEILERTTSATEPVCAASKLVAFDDGGMARHINFNGGLNVFQKEQDSATN